MRAPWCSDGGTGPYRAAIELVVADDDGVAIVPGAAEEAVVARARARMNGESIVLGELLAGSSLAAVWQRHELL